MQEFVRKYFIDGDQNCAEAILHAAAEAWGLSLSPETYRALGPFGGGICCGETCGALAGAVAAIGIRHIDERMHQSPEAKAKTMQYLMAFEDRFGSTLCKKLKSQYAVDSNRCLVLVEQAAALLAEMEAQ